MNLILKTSFKNIFGKPLRSLMVIFSIFVCSFVAMFCFDTAGSLKDVVTNVYRSISNADIEILSSYPVRSEVEKLFPGSSILTINPNTETLYMDIKGEYNYVTTENMKVYGMDIREASDMGFLDYVDLKDTEVIVSDKYAAEFGIKEGSKITLHDRSGEGHEFTVRTIIPSKVKNPLLSNRFVAVVNKKAGELLSCGDINKELLMIDLPDGVSVEDAEKTLVTGYPNSTVVKLAFTDEQYMAEVTGVMTLIFMITFLLVIFVTISVANKIVGERMPFIGTLRSLGMSTARTGRILLLENLLYGLLGCIPGVLLFILLRPYIMTSMFSLTDSDGTVRNELMTSLSPFLIVAVILGAVLIECLIPLKAILAAMKTSIRDIIFDNRDTEYKYSRKMLTAGLVFFTAAIVSFFFRENILPAIICVLSTVISLALLFPYIFRELMKIAGKIMEKKGRAGWVLASVEAMTRKSTVTSGALCVTVTALCVVIFSFAVSAMNTFMNNEYDCDVVVSCSGSKNELSFIKHLDGISETENIFIENTEFEVNGIKDDPYGYIQAMPDNGFKMYKGIKGLPPSISEGTVIVDKRYALRNKISIGDDIKLTIDPDGVVPLKGEFKVAGFFDAVGSDLASKSLVLSEKDYISFFRDDPGQILIRCDDPAGVAGILKTYAISAVDSAKTLDELRDEAMETAGAMIRTMTAVLAVAVGMTFIGMVTNQLIGFDGRRKECAVMLSTAMNRRTLSGVLTKEVFLSSFVAVTTGTLAGTALVYVIGEAVANMASVYMDLHPEPLKIFLFWIVMIFVFVLTVLFPVRRLNKMKLSEQLKYE